MKQFKSMNWLGVALALLVPSLAVAALTIPNTFAAGDPVSASEMNENFAAIKAKVESLEAQIAAPTVAHYSADTGSALIDQVDMGAHAFCSLTRVYSLFTSYDANHDCMVVSDGDGTWTLTAEVHLADRYIVCEATCF